MAQAPAAVDGMTSGIERLGQRPRMADGSLAAYSPVVRAGPLVFVSGQLPFDPDRRVIAGGVVEHTRRCYANVFALLEAAGCGRERIVKTVNYLAREEDFGAFNSVYLEVFGDLLPARSTVVARLLVPAAALEVDVIAYVGP